MGEVGPDGVDVIGRRHAEGAFGARHVERSLDGEHTFDRTQRVARRLAEALSERRPAGLASIGLSEDGNTLAFGAIFDANEGSPANSGAVYVWSREPMSELTPARFLKAPRPGLEDFFGWSISLTESSLFVTALRDDTGGSGVDPVPAPDVDASGAAFAFSLTRP